MNKTTLTELWEEMAGHLQAALTLIESLLLAGPNEALSAAQREMMAGWLAFEKAARPIVLGPDEDGRAENGEGA
jgi:hypothetical protein